MSSSSASSPVSTPHSNHSTCGKNDYITDLQEQGCDEHAQTDHETVQVHEMCMACIEASSQKEKMRHERRVLKYQLQMEEAKMKTSLYDTHNQVVFENPPSPQYPPSQLGLGNNSFSSFNI